MVRGHSKVGDFAERQVTVEFFKCNGFAQCIEHDKQNSIHLQILGWWQRQISQNSPVQPVQPTPLTVTSMLEHII